MSQMIRFFVQGQPKTQGSKKAFYNAKLRRAIVVEDCKGNKPWRSDVRNEAEKVWMFPPLVGPVAMKMTFIMPRPQGHYGSGKNARIIKPNAPMWPDKKPDLTKLARAVEDALKGLVWNDDSQVVEETTRKVYTNDGRIGCLVEIIEIAQSAKAAA